MKIVCHNQRMLDTVIQELDRLLEEKGSIYIDFGKETPKKTSKQLGFYFGSIVDSIKDFYEEQGIEYEVDEIKENFYQAISPRKTVIQFNGKKYEVPKRISEMILEEMANFIDRSIWLCDNAKAFQGLILHPSIRHTWIRHIKEDDLRNLNVKNLPMCSQEYLQYLRGQACIVCGRQHMSEAHHLRIGGTAGTSTKPPDYMCVSLCRNCHRDYHTKGHQWFEQQCQWISKYISFYYFCICNFSRWYYKGVKK